MSYWLAKSEPSVYSIDHLKKDRKTCWEGVRNYQARNYLKSMKKGDLVLIYHSNADPTAVMGIAEVCKEAYPDPSQFDKKSKYFDSDSSIENPRWWCPEFKYVEKFKSPVLLKNLKDVKELYDMTLLQKGSRLSVHALTKLHFITVCRMGGSSYGS